MSTPASHIRVLSIDPTSRGFGFAVFESSDRLIDWGVVRVSKGNNRQCIHRIKRLIERYRPRTFVIEDTRRRSRRGPRARQLLLSIKKLATKRRMKLKAVLLRQVRLFFSQTGATTKHGVAEAIAKRFPELAPHLPPPRKPWNSEPEMMAVFDAVALALAVYGAHTSTVREAVPAPRE
jgi:Holliday junction resolvasome RuvABC endonuclease subunit